VAVRGGFEPPVPLPVQRFSKAPAPLANKMDPQAAAKMAKALAAALENPQEADSDRLSSLGEALATLCRLLASARSTHLLGQHAASASVYRGGRHRTT